MKGKYIFATAVAILLLITFWLVINRNGNLVKPAFDGIAPQPAVTSPTPNVPKTFKFDGSTDLELELEKVNPQILDSDYE